MIPDRTESIASRCTILHVPFGSYTILNIEWETFTTAVWDSKHSSRGMPVADPNPEPIRLLQSIYICHSLIAESRYKDCRQIVIVPRCFLVPLLEFFIFCLCVSVIIE